MPQLAVGVWIQLVQARDQLANLPLVEENQVRLG